MSTVMTFYRLSDKMSSLSFHCMLLVNIRPVLLQMVKSLTFGPEDLRWWHANQKKSFPSFRSVLCPVYPAVILNDIAAILSLRFYSNRTFATCSSVPWTSLIMRFTISWPITITDTYQAIRLQKKAVFRQNELPEVNYKQKIPLMERQLHDSAVNDFCVY